MGGISGCPPVLAREASLSFDKASKVPKKQEGPPVVFGVGYKYTRLRKGLSGATHVQVKVFPKTKGFLILEIYDADNKKVSVRWSKDPRNHYLPKKDVDLFKVRIPVEPAKDWQTLTVPLSKFVDWNRKREGCNKKLPGINENIGDGKLNPNKGESFQFQLVFEASGYDERASAYIGQKVNFIKYDKDTEFTLPEEKIEIQIPEWAKEINSNKEVE